MNMISTGAFQTEMDASNRQETLAEKFARVWEQKNTKIARAGGVSLMALSLAACGSDSDDSDPVVVADPDPDPVPVSDPEPAKPSVGFDELEGTSSADTMTFRVVQNSLGEQTNQFGTGDVVSLGAGSDTVDVIVQDATSLGDGPSASIAAYLTSVETANFTALNDSDGTTGADGSDTVEINAAFWLGTDVISSIASDASLTVYNVNTLNDDEAYGDVGELTSTMTVRMDHSGNDNNTVGAESDMTVLFDEDYLIAGSTSSASSATYYILDQDGALQNGTGTPLMHKVDANGQVDAMGATVAFTDSVGIAFSLDGVSYSVSLTQAQIEAATAAASYTHTDFVNDLTSNGGLPAGVTLSVDSANVDTTFLDDGSAYSVPAIVVNSANGGVFTNQSFVSNQATGVEFNEFGRFENTDPTVSGQTEINVELEKVGRDGDGGDLVIGGMEDSGIQVFHVEVQGRADQPSSLASLASTNNTLEEVYVEADTGAAASLEIGNGNTDGDITNALVDVRVFDAASFDNGVAVNASVTDASVAKYMDRGDQAADPSADNANFAYSTGAGNDTVNVNISETNLAASGTANREDFSLSVATGDGNDSITMQIGDGDMGATAWLNHQTMDANADSRIGVDAGAGNDMVHTNGETIFRIDLGAGNDAGYTDNSGAQADATFNGGRATWVMGTETQTAGNADLDIDDLDSEDLGDVALWGAAVTVTYKDLTATSSTITDYNTTTLEMNNIIKGVIANDEHLSDLIVAEDGPGNTLIVRSLIDGSQTVNDFEVTLSSTAQTTMSDAALAAYNTANGYTAAAGTALTTLAQVNERTAENVIDFNGHAGGANNGDATSALTSDGDAAADDFNTSFDDELAMDNLGETPEVREVHRVDLNNVEIVNNETVVFTIDDGAGNTNVITYTGGATTVVGADAVAAIVAGLGTESVSTGDYVFSQDANSSVLIITEGVGSGGAFDGLDANNSIAVTGTAQDLVAAGDLDAGPLASTEVTDGSAATGGTFSALQGAASTADNDNTITDGTGNDTLVLSTDGDSAEQVVLVNDLVVDVIVNFTQAQDTIDYTGTWGAVYNSADGADNVDANTADMVNGEVAVADFVDVAEAGDAATTATWAGLTDAIVLAELNADADYQADAAATDVSALLFIENGATNQAKVYQLEDTDADANWESATLIDIIDLADTDIGTLATVDII